MPPRNSIKIIDKFHNKYKERCTLITRHQELQQVLAEEGNDECNHMAEPTEIVSKADSKQEGISVQCQPHTCQQSMLHSEQV